MRTTSPRRREFESLVLPHLDTLYAVALRYTHRPQDAEDLVQETVLRAYDAWDRFDHESNCRAWLIRILTNSFINHYRRARSHRRFAERPGDEPESAFFAERTRDLARDPEGTLLEGQLGDEVSRALADLPDDYRVVVVLCDLEGLSYREIADAVGIPVGTVMSRLFRARRQLEAKLAPYAAEDYGIRRAA